MVEYYKQLKEHEEMYKKHEEFYTLAEKYGFCTPWSHSSDAECKSCSTEMCCTE